MALHPSHSHVLNGCSYRSKDRQDVHIVGLEMRVCYVIVVHKKCEASENMLLVTLRILVYHTPNQMSHEIASYVTTEQ